VGKQSNGMRLSNVRVLILGATGMLGHKLYQVLNPIFDVKGTIRGHYSDVERYGIFHEAGIVPELDVSDVSHLKEVIERVNPNVVVNCIGIVKQTSEAQNRFLMYKT